MTNLIRLVLPALALTISLDNYERKGDMKVSFYWFLISVYWIGVILQ